MQPHGVDDQQVVQQAEIDTFLGYTAKFDEHGYRALHQRMHADSASVVALRQAGAIILGKTVTTELRMSQPGPTTNPFKPAHTPGGSSSVIGAGMVPAALGTQVVGSVIRPAGFCANTAKNPGVTHTAGLPAFNAATSVLGCPTITLPLMAVDGLPVGVQVIGQAHQDVALTGLAGWITEAIHPVNL